ncbi:uncharacterized protein LOC131858439 [Cryptomeria japonica]|uniref:uncharacterized protein LOC131858439 n=1 Tax=Cryptomeria japonica TaxID=3369 RepID=UPI0027DAA11A|nr:uncharacterized protein LOC131858439 [Cryptomeria japonica]
MDSRNKTLIDFLVASGGQVVFLKSIDALDEVKNAETLCNMLDEVVTEVGVQNLVQVVTDNAAAYVAAGKLLQARHPTLFWSHCVAHCLDLLLEDIGKLSWAKNVVEDGREITKYIYNHTWVLELKRQHTDGKDLVRSRVTRLATNFLNLQSILHALPNLKRMFVSERWLENPYCRKLEAEKVVKAVFDDSFDKLMEEIINLSELTKYEAIWRIIDRRWNRQLHQHIHAAAYYLNPKFFYSRTFKIDEEVQLGLDTCIQRLVPDENIQDLIVDE